MRSGDGRGLSRIRGRRVLSAAAAAAGRCGPRGLRAAVILEAAGLPLSDVYRERKRLMTLCEGHYRNCTARSEILKFHRRMIDSGLMDSL